MENNYIKILNENNKCIAILNNIISGSVKQQINGEYILSFKALIEPLKTEFLYKDNNVLEYNNNLFKVNRINESHDKEGMLLVDVYAEHESYKLLDQYKDDFIFEDITANAVCIEAFKNTGFNFTSTDITDKKYINLKDDNNVRYIQNQIANIWGGEFAYNQKNIEFKKQIGTNRGVDFRYGKNIQDIKRIVESDKAVAYEVNIVQGTNYEELSYYELGDTIRVIDNELSIDYYTRIIELEKDIITGLNNRVILGTGIKNLVTNNIEEIEKNKQENIKIHNKIEEQGRTLESNINITAQRLSSEFSEILTDEIAGVKEESKSLIEQTANNINLTVSNNKTWTEGQFTLVRKDVSDVNIKADGITSTVSSMGQRIDNQDGKIALNVQEISRVEQKANSIESTVTTKINGINTSITSIKQTTDSIALAVNSNKLKFDSSGLSMYNGGDKIFYVDTSGNVNVKGYINAGGVKIDNNGLTINNSGFDNGKFTIIYNGNTKFTVGSDGDINAVGLTIYATNVGSTYQLLSAKIGVVKVVNLECYTGGSVNGGTLKMKIDTNGISMNDTVTLNNDIKFKGRTFTNVKRFADLLNNDYIMVGY